MPLEGLSFVKTLFASVDSLFILLAINPTTVDHAELRALIFQN